jgi:predicted CoA-substrate-specific enzyme activase
MSGAGGDGLYAGIDSGSWTTKAVVITPQAQVLALAVVRTAADLPLAAEEAFARVTGEAGIDRRRIRAVCATGFGRQSVPFAGGTRTELDCHARGVRHYVAAPFTVIDIGGQDAKVIRTDDAGRRIAHKMNRKCAAGTGSFLDEMALRLNLPTDKLPQLAAGFVEEVELGSFCTVFTGTELLAAIRRGVRPADLARAAYRSVVKRILEMDVLEGTVVATGGVIAHHPMVVSLLESALGGTVIVPPHPQEMGAFGAALAARDGIGTDRRSAAAERDVGQGAKGSAEEGVEGIADRGDLR